ncbi:MAG: argininosuccinate lyase, partial [Planctomycetes bacterium]|nr:argininosuccinate lyase [Planctomycetota bacterium]
RFSKKTHSLVETFTESISFDRRLYKYDIEGSIAHTRMLEKCNLVTTRECKSIINGLMGIEKDIESGTFQFKTEHEDIHMNIESALVDRIGDVAKKLHTARSRNDQIALDLRLWMRDQIQNITEAIVSLQLELVIQAKASGNNILPGFTHLQHAQPVMAGHYFLAYVEMLERDRTRLIDCRKRVNVSPLGACALAGTTLLIKPEITAKLLGFDSTFDNSIDAVSDRDFSLEFASVLSIISVHLSRFCEEWIIWSSQGFDFLDIDDSYCTGSSIMPQKKNPDVLEIMRGKCGRVYGNLFSLLTIMKGLPLSYNRDMQEDKEAIFDSSDTIIECLVILKGLIGKTTLKFDHMEKSCEKGFLDATGIADYLVTKGVPFRQSHEIVGKIVKKCSASGTRLQDVSLRDFKKFSLLIDKDIYKTIGVANYIRQYKSPGSTSPASVRKKINGWERKLKKHTIKQEK